MKIPLWQLERIVAALTIGLAVAVERGKMTTNEANQLLFTPHTMALLQKYGARESVVTLVHAGTEIEDIELLIPDKLSKNLHELVEDALTCLESGEPYDFNADKWLSKLVKEPETGRDRDTKGRRRRVGARRRRSGATTLK